MFMSNVHLMVCAVRLCQGFSAAHHRYKSSKIAVKINFIHYTLYNKVITTKVLFDLCCSCSLHLSLQDLDKVNEDDDADNQSSSGSDASVEDGEDYEIEGRTI